MQLPAGPAYRRLYEQLRTGILSGQFKAGSRLPASRTLATEVGVSRNTVLAAFEQLDAEGYLNRRRGSGTYVAHLLPEQMLTANYAPGTAPGHLIEPSRLSERGRVIAGTARMPLPAITGTPSEATAFQIGLPALDSFPSDLWARMHAARWRRSSRDLMRYNDPAGHRPLREAIASYVATSRGIRCTPDQVVIVSGSQQALEFCARILLDPGDPAWIEDPCYLGARAALVSAGARLVPVPVDKRGIDVMAGIEREPRARLAVVTPSHQFPLGVTLSLDRRLALIEWAARTGSWVVEDDYDSEFRYRGRPLAALQAIDRYQRVIYVGTFSKVMFPGLRLGYLIAPEELVDGFVAAHLSTDVHAHLLDQAVLSDFMEAGHFARHLRRMRVLYGKRQQILVREAMRRLDGALRIEGSDGGLHLVGWLPEHLDDRVVAETAAREGIHVWPLSLHCMDAELPPALLIGYAGTKESDIPRGIDTLGLCLGGQGRRR
ncbi:transcriptional regulator, GntR family domain / Aspartate aminotransferase [Rhodococcus wratislaviensis]|uniref:Transcriptional regulator, GntR family domain / Aspartate aminotransferase n=1 Tax=Rhodococcus wratislaviensis TaxID=44752 RepID=A0A402CN04_RHOWR|nr:PLP-dependent aminotransferase family protein [Rhodococcus wratislaviensis]GCE45020.1 transcriptional regulator, GntR family domain / Aspartate aminotransferase [Rhodococcus wratislaviensis]